MAGPSSPWGRSSPALLSRTGSRSAWGIPSRQAAAPGKPEAVWSENGAELQELRLVENGRIAAVSPPGVPVLDAAVVLKGGWIRAEAWGLLEGKRQRLALTSPIYVGRRER